MNRLSSQNVTIRELVDLQRRLARTRDTIEQVIGTLWIGGVLGKRLRELTDRQVGQLPSDVVAAELGISEPETTICQLATLRLFRSPVGRFTTRDKENLKQRTACPKCGNEMLLSYGIDEQDYLECALAICGYRMGA